MHGLITIMSRRRVVARLLWVVLCAAGTAFALTGRAQAQAPGLGAQVELVDPHVFRVCADPNNMPFSDEKGDGFENKLAELMASGCPTPIIRR
jgi:mxaJ protein